MVSIKNAHDLISEKSDDIEVFSSLLLVSKLIPARGAVGRGRDERGS